MLIDIVSSAIKSYIDSGNGRRSLTSLARRADGVSYATLRRIVNKETQNPNIDTTIIPVLSVFMTPSEIYNLISPHDESWAKRYKNFLGIDETFDFIDKDEITWHELDQTLIAMAVAGTSRDIIEKDFGRKIGIERLEVLLNAGLLKEINNRISISGVNLTDSSPASMMKKIELNARNFNLKNIGQGAAIFLVNDALSKADYERCKKVFCDAIKEVNEIRRNPEGSPLSHAANFNLFINFSECGE